MLVAAQAPDVNRVRTAGPDARAGVRRVASLPVLMSALSRRALFGFGLSRVLEELDPACAPSDAAPTEPDLDVLREQLRAAWSASHGGRWWSGATSLLADAAPVSPGERVLDAGAGDGDLALLAAGRGATVTACDFAPALVGRGRTRTVAAGADVDWIQADMEALPYEDASFDRVLSGFAPMFCLHARTALAELFRVVRPGGVVALTAWAGGGLVGGTLRLADRRARLPVGIASPLSWGRDEQLRVELERHAIEVDVEVASLMLRFGTREDACAALMRDVGPLARVGEAMSHDLRELVDRLDRGDGAVELPARVLVAVARRPAPHKAARPCSLR